MNIDGIKGDLISRSPFISFGYPVSAYPLLPVRYKILVYNGNRIETKGTYKFIELSLFRKTRKNNMTRKLIIKEKEMMELLVESQVHNR